ncbi:two-component system catabolic regulation response regulator CreB [Inhella inkyongensis]|uniref:Two-component system catabolic regulation response regulator CreB n=1 Tax=Inhella inkyongensis TaxID=392593 RepID=A0A840SA17_9BURK|nr:response regulator [Inhella inkyongensis]MBB5205249.1 two-component system catabolic regulation response regulator CreB [Inhella inkyongensis]
MILLLEDDPAIAQTVSFALQREGFEVAHHSWLKEARAAWAQQAPRCAVLDIGLPDGSGLDWLRELRQQGWQTPILMLSARGEELDRVLGLELGADDYLCKPFSPRELVARVRGLLRRAAPSSHPGLRIEGLQAHWNGQLLDLTRRELALLQALLEAPGRVLSRDQLLDRAWGQASEAGDRTVDTHIKTLRAKLTEAGAAEFIRTHRGLGYSWDPCTSA